MTTTPEPQCTGGAAIDHPETGVCNHAASEPAVPAVGDKYTCTTETGTRTVTVTRVGQNIDGPAVEFEWRDPQSPLCGAGLTLPVFLGTYKPAEVPEDTLPAWLYGRFGHFRPGNPPHWADVTADGRAYWEHEAAAVRRAVARGGFKTPAGGEQA